LCTRSKHEEKAVKTDKKHPKKISLFAAGILRSGSLQGAIAAFRPIFATPTTSSNSAPALSASRTATAFATTVFRRASARLPDVKCDITPATRPRTRTPRESSEPSPHLSETAVVNGFGVHSGCFVVPCYQFNTVP
jgi:hypothetical protein